MFNNNPCTPPQPPTPEQKDSMAGQMMKSMGGLNSCYRDNSVYTTTEKSGGGVSLGLWGAGGGSTKTTVDAKNISIGCEQMTAIAQSFNSTQQNIACILTQTQNKQTTTLDSTQIMKLTCDGDMDVSDVSQTMNATLVSEFTLSNEEINNISNQLKNSSNQAADILSESKSGFAATPQGQKIAMDIRTNINNIDFNQNIRQKLNEFNTMASAKQYMELTGHKNCNFKNLSQNMQISVLAKAMTNDVITNVFKNVTENINQQDSKAVVKSENAGKPPEPNKSEDSTLLYVVIGILAFFGVLILGYYFYKENKKEKLAAVSQLPYGYPPSQPPLTPSSPPSSPPYGYPPSQPSSPPYGYQQSQPPSYGYQLSPPSPYQSQPVYQSQQSPQSPAQLAAVAGSQVGMLLANKIQQQQYQ
jgi:hypothetical protein